MLSKLSLGLLISCCALPAAAEVSYLSCDVGTTFYRPAANNTDWVHREGDYTKIFKVDGDAKMVSLYNRREGSFTPTCSATNKACAINWNGANIAIDGSIAADNPVAPFLDFRRSVQLEGNRVRYQIDDFGFTGKSNMRWVFEGSCKNTDAPAPVARRGGGPGGPPGGPASRNPLYVDAGLALAVDKAEADKALAGYFGNTMWGYSGGKHWFHMWFLDGSTAYTGDDEDITSEGKPHAWYVGKDSAGYRLCGQPIPATGANGCYPLPVRKLGEAWVQHDMDGDAQFSLLPGRQ